MRTRHPRAVTVGNLNINEVHLLQHLSPPTKNQTGISDTGATGHFLRPTAPHNQYTTGAPPIVVSIPNDEAMRSTQECQLQLNQLPAQARTGHILPGLARHPLISIGHFCDASCTAEFTANTVKVKKDGNILISGWRAPPGLWHLPLTNKDNTVPQTPPESHNAYKTTTKAEHMQYLHAVAFSPVPATWIKAIQKGFSTSWPGLTAKSVGKYLPKSIANSKGHLDQTRKNVCSTQLKEPELTQLEGERLDHPTHQIFASIEHVGCVYTDQTGRFPVT